MRSEEGAASTLEVNTVSARNVDKEINQPLYFHLTLSYRGKQAVNCSNMIFMFFKTKAFQTKIISGYTFWIVTIKRMIVSIMSLGLNTILVYFIVRFFHLFHLLIFPYN